MDRRALAGSLGVHAGAFLLLVLLLGWPHPAAPAAKPSDVVFVDLAGSGQQAEAPVRAPARTAAAAAPAPAAAPLLRATRPVADVQVAHRPDPHAKERARAQAFRTALANHLASEGHDLSADLQGNAPPGSSGAAAHAGHVAGTDQGFSGDLRGREILGQVDPVYPMHARQAGLEGDVRLRVGVGSDGRVADLQVVGSSGIPDLDAAAEGALRHWTFSAAPSAPEQWGEITLSFRLED